MIAEKYLPHIENLMSDPEVAEFATEVYNKARLLLNGTISQSDFNDGNYLVIFDNDFEHTKLVKNSINYIKEMIANDPLQ